MVDSTGVKGSLSVKQLLYDFGKTSGNYDYYKYDTESYNMGNEQEISNKIKDFMQDLGVVCRYGGEEFVILLPKLDINEAYLLAKKLNENIANLKIEFEGNDIYLTVSIGVADIKTKYEKTIEQALHRADNALYRVKNSGKNSVEIEV